MKTQKQKLGNDAFIDSQNLNLAIRDQGWKLDFAKFHDYLREKFRISKSFLFIGYVSGNEALYTYLQRVGFIVVFKPTLEIKREGKIITKGNVDAELVLHTMIEYPNYNKAIVVSGDGDFHCLLEYLEIKSKLGYIIIPNRKKYSALLRRFRRYFVYMNNLKDTLRVQNKKERE